MKTFKIKTETQTNYCIWFEGLFFAVRKNNVGHWMAVSYKAENLYTDNYIVKILDGFKTKKDAINALSSRIKEARRGFFHNNNI